MTDERIEADLAAYVDGVLDPAARGEIEQMLAGSPRYAKMVDEMRQAKSWLGDLPTVAPPPGQQQLADPTVARLEREALFAEAGATGVRRLFTPGLLAIAATLIIAVTLAMTAYVLLPGDTSPPRQAREMYTSDGGLNVSPPPEVTIEEDPDTDVDPPVEQREPDPTPEPMPEPPTVARGDPAGVIAPGESVDPGVIPPVASVPMVPDEAVLIAAATPEADAAARRVAGHLAAEALEFQATRLGPLGERLAVDDQIARRLERAGVAALAMEGPVRVFELPRPMSRRDVSAVLRASTSNRTPSVAVYQKTFEPDGLGVRAQVRRGEAGGTDLRPAEPTDEEKALADAARRIFPNDRLNFYFRRSNPDRDLPVDLPDDVEALMTAGRGRIEIPVDADGFGDFSQLGLGRIDILGEAPRDLQKQVSLALAEEYLVGLDFTVSTSFKADVPGGRTPAAIEFLRVDRNPFRLDDAVRVDFEDGRRIEGVVRPDGLVSLGDLGVMSALDRTPGELQREVIEKLPEAEMPPAVVNLSLRRASELDETAGEETSVLILLFEVDEPEPTTLPTTVPASPATRPG
ncbi:MAG: hypothetical protein AAGI46_15010 [Planctomycetota bacterium]